MGDGGLRIFKKAQGVAEDIFFTVTSSDKISDLKAQIEKEKGYPAKQLKLWTSRGEELKDDDVNLFMKLASVLSRRDAARKWDAPMRMEFKKACYVVVIPLEDLSDEEEDEEEDDE